MGIGAAIGGILAGLGQGVNQGLETGRKWQAQYEEEQRMRDLLDLKKQEAERNAKMFEYTTAEAQRKQDFHNKLIENESATQKKLAELDPNAANLLEQQHIIRGQGVRSMLDTYAGYDPEKHMAMENEMLRRSVELAKVNDKAGVQFFNEAFKGRYAPVTTLRQSKNLMDQLSQAVEEGNAPRQQQLTELIRDMYNPKTMESDYLKAKAAYQADPTNPAKKAAMQNAWQDFKSSEAIKHPRIGGGSVDTGERWKPETESVTDQFGNTRTVPTGWWIDTRTLERRRADGGTAAPVQQGATSKLTPQQEEANAIAIVRSQTDINKLQAIANNASYPQKVRSAAVAQIEAIQRINERNDARIGNANMLIGGTKGARRTFGLPDVQVPGAYIPDITEMR